MQVKVTLYDADIAVIRAYIAGEAKSGGQKLTHLMQRLGKALDKPAAPTKTTGKQLWQVIGRPDLKGSLEACKVAVIAGERIVECWRMAEGSIGMGEACAQCGKALGRARLSVIGGPEIDCDADGTVRVSQHVRAPSLAHKACGPKWMGIVTQQRATTPDDLYWQYDQYCKTFSAKHPQERKLSHEDWSIGEIAKHLITKASSTAYQRFALVKPTWRDGAPDLRWESIKKAEQEKAA